MLFSDEKELWYADKESLAKLIANKNERDVLDILTSHDIIRISTREEPSVTPLGRLMFPFVVALLYPVAMLKWVMTGDMYLDSWIKRSTVLTKIINFVYEGW